MILVRTALQSDIDGVLELAKQAYPGMTTLPPERDVLEAKLLNSVSSIEQSLDNAEESTYFLVMEDTDTQAIVGTAAIIASLGATEEFYS